LTELAVNLAALRDSPSVISPAIVEQRSGDDHVQAGGRDASVRDRLRDTNERLGQLRSEIEEAVNDVEREELEREQQLLRNRVRRLTHMGSEERQRARERIDRDLRRLREGLCEADFMPEFSAHLERAINFDGKSDMYVYSPGHRISWEIRGF